MVVESVDIMNVGKRILSVMLASLLAFSILSVSMVEMMKVSAQGVGSLTGTIYDSGLDTDDDGAFNFLEVGVEVNVSTAGTFRVEVSGLFDSAYNYIGVWDEVFAYLDLGIQVVYLHLDGPTIYESGFDPANVTDIYLEDEN